MSVFGKLGYSGTVFAAEQPSLPHTGVLLVGLDPNKCSFIKFNYNFFDKCAILTTSHISRLQSPVKFHHQVAGKVLRKMGYR